jgi:N utilization substance protein B
LRLYRRKNAFGGKSSLDIRLPFCYNVKRIFLTVSACFAHEKKGTPRGGNTIMAMTRREARELAFTLLFEMTFDMEKEPMLLYLQELEARGFEDNDYVKSVVVGCHEKREELDTLIEKYSNGWKVKRISRVSLAIMRLCIYEMLYMPDIPDAAAINEAVEIAKAYEDPDVVSFINGILGAFLRKEVPSAISAPAPKED